MDVLIGWPGGDWQSTASFAGVIVGGYLLVLWLATVLWAYRDTAARTRDPISRVIGVGLVALFPFVGIPIYMVVRPAETLRHSYERQLEQEAILSELHSASACPNCRRPVQDEFMVCAYCQTSLKEPCASCARLLTYAWRVCPYCSTPREARGQAAPAAARAAVEARSQEEQAPPTELEPRTRPQRTAGSADAPAQLPATQLPASAAPTPPPDRPRAAGSSADG